MKVEQALGSIVDLRYSRTVEGVAIASILCSKRFSRTLRRDNYLIMTHGISYLPSIHFFIN